MTKRIPLPRPSPPPRRKPQSQQRPRLLNPQRRRRSQQEPWPYLEEVFIWLNFDGDTFLIETNETIPFCRGFIRIITPERKENRGGEEYENLFLFFGTFALFDPLLFFPLKAKASGLFLDDDDDDFLGTPAPKPVAKEEPVKREAPAPTRAEREEEEPAPVAAAPAPEKKKPVGGVSVFGAIPPKGAFLHLSLSLHFFMLFHLCSPFHLLVHTAKGIFDEDEDDMFAAPVSKPKAEVKAPEPEKKPEPAKEVVAEVKKPVSKVPAGLFDDDDDDTFAVKPKEAPKAAPAKQPAASAPVAIAAPKVASSSLFDADEEDLFGGGGGGKTEAKPASKASALKKDSLFGSSGIPPPPFFCLKLPFFREPGSRTISIQKTVDDGDDFFGAPKAKPAAQPPKAEAKSSKGGLFGEVADDVLTPEPPKATPKVDDDLNKKGSVLAALTKEEKKEEAPKVRPFSFVIIIFFSILIFVQLFFFPMQKKTEATSIFDADEDPLFSSPASKPTSNLDKLKASMVINPKALAPGAAPPVAKVVPTAAPSFEEPRKFPSFPEINPKTNQQINKSINKQFVRVTSRS